jgi:hypothetical protein
MKSEVVMLKAGSLGEYFSFGDSFFYFYFNVNCFLFFFFLIGVLMSLFIMGF